MNTDWADLPGEVRAAVQDRAGKVVASWPVEGGNHSDFTAVLNTETGRVFAKGTRTEPDRQDIRTLRKEALIAPHVTEFAPRLLWTAEAGGWLMLGFEHVEGRHPDYAPGSPDLPLLADTITRLQKTPCPPVVDRRIEQRWARLTDDLQAVRGRALLHCDLNPGNVLITPEGAVRVVDWAFTCRGAAWVELGLLLPWLLKAGMNPGQAAAWVGRFPSWQAAPPQDIDVFTRLLAEQWRRQRQTVDTGWVAELADLTSRWEAFRLS